MKKTLLTVPLFFLCCWFYGNGQTPDWVWARSGSSGVNDKTEGWNIAVDNFDNVFLTGVFTDSVSFGLYTLPANYASAYLAKYDANGNIKWLTSNAYFNDSSVCVSYSVCTDKHGNSYITGLFTDSVVFGAFTLIANGYEDVFLTKFDSMGNVQWAKCAGGIYGDEGRGVACDAAGNVYITGRFNSSSITFGTYTLINSGSFNVFLAKFDSAGNVLWAICSNSDDAGGFSVTTDASGNVYVTGYFGYAHIISFGSDTLSCVGNFDLFLAKYDSSGNVLWARGAGGNGPDNGNSVSVDSSGNVYLAGFSNSNSISFGSHTITFSSSDESFLAKYDSSGIALWAKDVGGFGFDEGYSVAADKNGRIYMSGSFVYDTLNFDTISLLNPISSGYAMFILCSDSSGHALWGKVLGDCGDDNNAVAVGPSGCIYVGSDFSTINPLIIGHDTLFLFGDENPFVAKLCNINLEASFTTSSSIFCSEPTHCINFFDQSSGNPTSWHWNFTGATPDSSNSQNPDSICYGSPGTYPVTLIVSNGTITDSLTIASMIIVGGTPMQPTITIVGGDTLYSSHGSSYQWYRNGTIISGATDSFYVAHQSGTYSVQITDQYGCLALSSGTDVGIDELSGGGGVAVYPNPFSDELTTSPPAPLQRRGEWEFTLYDVTSRVLLRHLFTDQTTINTEQLALGIYFYEVKNADGIAARGKAIKE